MLKRLLSIFLLLGTTCVALAKESYKDYKHVEVTAERDFSAQLVIQHAIYELTGVYDLKGAIVNVPEDCILQFSGGVIKNGTLKGRNTILEASLYKVFDGVSFSGTWCAESIKPEWFGAKGDGNTDDTKAIREALNCGIKAGEELLIPVQLRPAEYMVSNEVSIPSYGSLQGIATSAQAGYLSKSQSTIIYKGKGECVLRVANSYTSIKNLCVRIDNKLYKTDGIFYDASKNRVIHNDLSGIHISGARYGISSVLGCEGSGFSYANFDGIEIIDCVRGISIDSSNNLSSSKEYIITYITHCLFHNCTISTCREKGFYFDAYSLLDNVKIDYCCIELIGLRGAFDTKYSKSGIYAIEMSLRGNDSKYETIGVASISDCYIEGVYYSSGTLKNGKYRVDGFDYDNNSVIRVKNINLSVQSNNFVNCLSIVKSDGADYIYMNANTDEGFWEGKNDTGRFYLCKENPKTRLFINGYTFKNRVKDAIKSSILSNPIRAISINNIYRVNTSFQDRMDKPFEYNNRAEDGTINVYVTDSGEGSGIFYNFPTNIQKMIYAAFDYSPSINFKLLSDINLSRPVIIQRNNSGGILKNQKIAINCELGGHKIRYNGTSTKDDAMFEIGDINSFSIMNGTVDYTPSTNSIAPCVVSEKLSTIGKGNVSFERIDFKVPKRNNQTMYLIRSGKDSRTTNKGVIELDVVSVSSNNNINKNNVADNVIIRDNYLNSRVE